MQHSGCLDTSASLFQPLWHMESHGLLFYTNIVQDHIEACSDSVCWVAAAGIASELCTEEPAAFLSCRYAAALMDSSFWGAIRGHFNLLWCFSSLSSRICSSAHTESLHRCSPGFRFVSPLGGRKDSLSDLVFVMLA